MSDKNQERRDTQMFLIRDIITGYCGQLLTPDLVDEVVAKFEEEITDGSCAWAFTKKASE